MTEPAVPAAIVLAGGQSSRMGVDKATLVVDGTRLIDRVLDALGRAGIDRVVVAGPDIDDLDDGITCIPDPVTEAGGGLGPLAGIVSAWSALRRDRPSPDPVVVVACDLPRLSAAGVRALAEQAAGHRHGAIADDGERLQPLLAAYRPTALDAMTTAFERGERSVRRLFGEWDLATRRLPSQELGDADTPTDLAGFDVSWPEEPPRASSQ